MTANDLFTDMYLWLNSMAVVFFVAGVAIPVAGTGLAWIGKKGKTDADGRMIANAFIGFSLALVMVEVAVVALAVSVMDADPLEADVALLMAPIICVTGCVFGIGRVFPVNDLASMRTFKDVAWFLAACVVVVWLFSAFRGWGILFFGGIPQLVVIGVLIYFVVKRLYGRAFKKD